MSRRVFTPELDAQLLRMKEVGARVCDMARAFGVSGAGVIHRMRKLGVPVKARPRYIWKHQDDPELHRLYTQEGYGVLRCANHFKVTYKVAEGAVKRLGILDSSRQHQRQSGRVEGQRKRRPCRFTLATIRRIYERDGGVCKWCKGLTTPEDRVVHHIVPVDEALKLGWPPSQIRAMENGETLHRTCHTDPEVFKVLHNGRQYRFGLQGARTPESMCACGGRKLLIGDFCFDCGLKAGALSKGQVENGMRRRKIRVLCSSCSRDIMGKNFNGRCRACAVNFVKNSSASALEIRELLGVSLVCAYRLMRDAGTHPRD